MPIVKIVSFANRYVFLKDQGNISFLNKVTVSFRNSKWPLTLVAILDLKVGGDFEFTKSAVTLSRKKIIPLTF